MQKFIKLQTYAIIFFLIGAFISVCHPLQANKEDKFEDNDSRETAINIRNHLNNFTQDFNGTHIIDLWAFSHLILENQTNEEDWFVYPMVGGEICHLSVKIHSGGSLNIELWEAESLMTTYNNSIESTQIIAEFDQNLSIGFRWLMGDQVDYSFNISEYTQFTPRSTLPLRMGWDSWISSIDPLQLGGDTANINYAEQICEGLFAWESINESFQFIPRLASGAGTWSTDYLEFTVPLRTDVWFHDGTPFDAIAVKWNFDRLLYFLNQGILYIPEFYPLAHLYPDQPLVINRIDVLNSMTVRFRLNYPFGAFEQLLTFYGSLIVSPKSTPWDRLIVIGQDRLVGTGPYIQLELNDQNATFCANPFYYRPQPAVQQMDWIHFSSSYACSQALLNHSIQLINRAVSSYESNYTDDPLLIYYPHQPSLSVFFLTMNNHLVNKTLRQAISYAINYTHIIDVICDDLVSRAEHYIPFGIPYYNSSIHIANYNLSLARSILIEAGIAPPQASIWPDEYWTEVGLSDVPLATFNYTYIVGSIARQQIGDLLKINLQAIGIKLNLCSLQMWTQFLDKLMYKPDELELFIFGKNTEYADPFPYLDSLLNRFITSDNGNFGQVNDDQLQSLLTQVISTPNPETRQQTYDIIQTYLATDLMPYALLYINNYYDVHLSWLNNFYRNPLGVFDIYRCTWNPEGAFVYVYKPAIIKITQDQPFSLTWKPFLYGNLTAKNCEIRNALTNSLVYSYDSYDNATAILYNHPNLTVGNYVFKITFFTYEGIYSSSFIAVLVSPVDITTTTTITTTSTTSDTLTNPFVISILSYSPIMLLLVCPIVIGILVSYTRKKYQ